MEEYREAYPPEKNPFKLPDEKSISEKDLLYDLEALKKRLDEANDRRSQLEQALSGVLEKYYSVGPQYIMVFYSVHSIDTFIFAGKG